MFKPLLKELADLTKRTARFRRVALHVHSPDSPDWARTGGADPVRNDRTRFAGPQGLEVFASESKAFLDLIAIADHMKCNFATELSANIGVNDDFMVIPGMEVNFRPSAALGFARIHLVVLLPEGSFKEDFMRLFHDQPGIPPDAQRTGKEEVTGLTLSAWVKRVHEVGGICIAAHVDNTQGVRYLFRQTARETLKLFSDSDGQDLEREFDVADTLKEYLFDSHIDGVEIHRATDALHYRWQSAKDDKTRLIPTVLTFDSHCVEDLAKTDRVTHIKMTKLGLGGLKDALVFADTRIRFPDNLPTPPNPRLLGIKISGDSKSFFENITIAFSENLNCVIGARGSGKSTVVEALRYTFGYNRTLADLGKSLRDTIKDMQKANLAGSLIQVLYKTSSGEERVLSSTYDDKSDYSTKVRSISGEVLEVADVETSGDYPFRLFGWSEIETLGRSPTKQRELLDRLVPELTPVLKNRKLLRDELTSNRAILTQNIADINLIYNKNDKEIRRYKEFKLDFEKLNTPEVKNLFYVIDLTKSKISILEKVESNTNNVLEKLGDPSVITLQSNLQKALEKGQQELRDWWTGQEIGKLGVLSVEQDVQKALREAIERLKIFKPLIKEHKTLCDAELANLQNKLIEKFASDTSMQKIADLRINAENRLAKISDVRDNYKTAWKTLTDNLNKRQVIADKLTATHNEIAGLRARHNVTVEKRLNAFLPTEMRVNIDFRAGGDTQKFREELDDIFGSRGNQIKKLKRVIGNNFTPISFCKMVLSNKFESMIGIKDDVEGGLEEIRQEDADLCMARTQYSEYDDMAEVDILTGGGAGLKTILDLQEVPWDDHEAILLNGGPVNEKSPGQRSSAMLPLISLAENTPLIIDQPEDNLDKQLIGNVLSKVLSDLKEKRQIIVCTHDPNILVGGDSEQVIVLEAESDRKGKVSNHGSIDNDDIVNTVINILEGGKDAFEVRKARYKM